MINFMLHAVYPLAQSEDFPPPEQKQKADNLLARTAALIDSDSYTSRRHRGIAKQIRKQLVVSAAAQGDPKLLDRLISDEVKAIMQRYSTYTGTTNYKRREMQGILMELVSKGMIGEIPSFIRQLIQRTHDGRQDYQDAGLAKVCVEIQKLKPEKQYDLLHEIALGRDGDGELVQWNAIVCLSVTPELVKRQVGDYDAMRRIPTVSDDAPVTGTVLLLAEVAAQLGRSDELAGELAGRIAEPGDSFDLASKLVLLTAAKRSSSGIDVDALLRDLDTSMKPVEQRIRENKPTKTDRELKYPMLEWMVLLRAMDAGWPKEKAIPILREIKPYAVRAQNNLMVSVASRVIALSGSGRAAGGKPSSPWKHFVSVPLPYRHKPDLATLEPLYAVDKEGWFSGTGGYGLTLMTLRYPLTGSFTVSAEIADGKWGESDVNYGGVLYQPAGYAKKARVGTINGGTIEFPVPDIEHNATNVESVRVSPDETVGLCNDEPYVTDIAVRSYPWVSLSQFMYRTTQLKNFRIEGNPQIPREVNLIDPTMRGWVNMYTGHGSVDPRLPIGPEQDADDIRSKRETADSNLKKERPTATWAVKDDELGFRKPATGQYDSDTQLQYMRPLFEGESLEIVFWWKSGDAEVAPTIGRMALKMSEDGVTPQWIACSGDAAVASYATVESLDPPRRTNVQGQRPQRRRVEYDRHDEGEPIGESLAPMANRWLPCQ